MVTIAKITEKLIQDKPFIHETLEMELVNLGALADYLKPDIEKELGQKVKTTAISMSIRRYVEKKNMWLKKVKLTSRTDILVKSNLFSINIAKSPSLYEKLPRLYDIIDFSKGDTLNVIHGNYEVLIISNDRYVKDFKQELKSEKITMVRNNISSISVKIPKMNIEVPGFYHAITKALLLQNISIIDIVNTHTEATLILHDKDIPKAYEVLKKEISIEFYK